MNRTNTTIRDQITQIQLFKLCLKKREQQNKRLAYDSLWCGAPRCLSGSRHGEPFEGEFKCTNPSSAVLGAAGSTAAHAPHPARRKPYRGASVPINASWEAEIAFH